MKTKKAMKKLLSLLLVFSLIFSTVSVAAVAVNGDTAESTVKSETKEEETAQDENAVINEIKQVITEDSGHLYYYNVDNSGLMTLDKVEEKNPIKKVFNAFKAPKSTADDLKAEIDWTKFEVSDLVAFDSDGNLNGGLVHWMMHNNNDIVKKITDKNGNSYIVRGAANYAEFEDKNFDRICDLCGYCLFGCSDGELKYYSEDDFATKQVIDGTEYHYNSEGVEIGHVVKDVIIYDDGTKEEKERVQYESYLEGNDGICDVCGHEFCSLELHDYSDHLCDNCNLCTGNHVDTDHDGKCDICSRCTSDCKDESGTDVPDGKCDVCDKAICESCQDDGNGVCSVCGKCTGEHTDEDNDGACDVCHTCINGCTDETGAQASDGFCDECGYCMAECVDANGDKKCDNCKHDFAECNHVDLFGTGNCSQCGKQYCKVMNNAELYYASGIYGGIFEYLSKLDEEGDQPYDEWLKGEFADFLAKGKDENGNEYTGISAKIDFRSEIATVSQNDALIDLLKEKVE